MARVVDLEVSNEENFAFCLHGDLKKVSFINLEDMSVDFFVEEKDLINSMAISP